MKKKILLKLIAISLSACLFCTSCSLSDDGSECDTGISETSLEEPSEVTDVSADELSDAGEEEPTRIYSLEKIGSLDPLTALNDYIPEGYYRSWPVDWGMAYEDIYYYCNISPDDSTQNATFCVQIMEAPYTEWTNYFVEAEEWVEGEICKVVSATLTVYGELYVLLSGREGFYSGSWSPESGCYARKLECDYQIFNNDAWYKGDTTGNFFVTNNPPAGQMYQFEMLWLDDDFKNERALPDPSAGYIWQTAETPVSGNTYLLGSLPEGIEITTEGMSIYNTGFAIWEEGNDVPVFTTEHTGMSMDDIVLFYSDTDGYLFNHGGIWEFSLEDNSITWINDRTLNWQKAMILSDESALMISGYYNVQEEVMEYSLWKLNVDIL